MSVEKCNRSLLEMREKAVVIKAYMGQLVVSISCASVIASLSHSGAELRFVLQAHKSLHVQTCT